MAVNAKKVLVGTPDQKVTGAIMSAPIGTPLPQTIDDELDEAFTNGDSGYVSSDGLTLTPDVSTNDINEWGGALVRRVLETFSGSLSWTYIETGIAELRNAFGDNNVEVTAEANDQHGTQVRVGIGAELPARKSWLFRMKDGDARVMIVVPDAQPTSFDDITFNATDPIPWPINLATYPDANGKSIYILLDDGQKIGVAPVKKPVTGVDLTPETATVTEGEDVDLTVAFTPDDATDQTYTVASSDDETATAQIKVGSPLTVVVHGVKENADPVTVTVTTNDGAKTASAQVTVAPKA
ncbi:hypothetical protein CSQ85_00190 [Bifidobacterium rousetti]|uniref:phage tail tube protein n=1 Tax=Bifidobacterium rousetti TaxID=2045439 RepID=UPI00123B890D|nr:Ig-like domain-containing protein [Bifidobacterium rousetti]KAA8820271.1 hypothetical protein CSQ85_00190 [Bifidobacterium rousetti]